MTWSVEGVTVVKVGTLCLEVTEVPLTDLHRLKHQLGIGGGSTVTAVTTPDGLLVVDTGFEREDDTSEANADWNRRALTEALRLRGLEPDDVDAVFITHWHRDHFGNLDLFQHAERLCGIELLRRHAPAGFRGIDDGEEICHGVRVLGTPGHTADHCSLLVERGRLRLCLAGDAVASLMFFDRGRVWNLNSDFSDAAAGRRSMATIADSCDLLVPGHGAPFAVHRPSWLKELRGE